MTAISLNEKVKIFAREILGCGCPNSVFEVVKMQSLDKQHYKLNVGNRLLIYIVRLGDEKGLREIEKSRLQYLRRGVAERDEYGFNRFRLVFARGSDLRIAEDKEREILNTNYDFCDGKTHVHIVDRSEIDSLDLF